MQSLLNLPVFKGLIFSFEGPKFEVSYCKGEDSQTQRDSYIQPGNFCLCKDSSRYGLVVGCSPCIRQFGCTVKSVQILKSVETLPPLFMRSSEKIDAFCDFEV